MAFNEYIFNTFIKFSSIGYDLYYKKVHGHIMYMLYVSILGGIKWQISNMKLLRE